MITVEGLTKTYGSRRAVDNLSSTITCGRVTGFVPCGIQRWSITGSIASHEGVGP